MESGGMLVRPAIADAKLKPVGGSSTSGIAVFKGVGNLGVQAALRVSGLPRRDHDAVYYAQLHRGSCLDARLEEDQGFRVGSSLALLRFERLLTEIPIRAKGMGLHAHGGDEPSIPEKSPGSIVQPIRFSASARNTASVTSLIEGVAPERLTSGGPEYIHVHAASSENAPEKELACGDMMEARGPGSW
jgi:hypothetical protein